jgi:hypothetical protein
MHLNSRWRMRRSLLILSAFAAGLCLLSPAAAGARGRARLQATVSEESVTEPLQEPPSEGETPAGGSGESSGESPAVTRTGERQERRERREKLREERRSSRQSVQGTSACTIDLEVSKRIATIDVPVTLQGTLTCAEPETASGQTVTLYQKLAHTHGFSVVTTTTTEANGTFEISPTELEAADVFYVSADGATSLRTSVKLAPQITIASPIAGTELFTGTTKALRASAQSSSAVTFTGTVSTADAGATVSLQREYRKGAWHRIGGGGVVNMEGEYSITHTFLRPGVASIRVVVHSHHLFMTSASAPISYRISRRASHQITIDSSANPVVYGQSVTISGTLAGTVDRTVTLLAQVGAGAFTPVAQITSNGAEYSFSESPTEGTHYRVISGRTSSEALEQGVTYALTPDPAADTVAAETPLSFTGTVAPGLEGQLVELERDDEGTYSVIATSTLSAGGIYSIPYTFTAPGSETLRIQVPGNAELQSVASEPFVVEVTSA